MIAYYSMLLAVSSAAFAATVHDGFLRSADWLLVFLSVAIGACALASFAGVIYYAVGAL